MLLYTTANNVTYRCSPLKEFQVMQYLTYTILKSKQKLQYSSISYKCALKFSSQEWKQNGMKGAEECCWAITQPCCSPSGSSLWKNGFQLDPPCKHIYSWHMYTQFQLTQISACSDPSTTGYIRVNIMVKLTLQPFTTFCASSCRLGSCKWMWWALPGYLISNFISINSHVSWHPYQILNIR